MQWHLNNWHKSDSKHFKKRKKDTHPKPVLPRVSTFLIAAERPVWGPSTRSFCPSNWSQICSSLCSYLNVSETPAVSPRWGVSVYLSSFLNQKWGKTVMLSLIEGADCFYVCVCVRERGRVCEEGIVGVLLREEQQGQNLLLKPSSGGPMQRRSDLGKLFALAPAGCYQFPQAPSQICCTRFAPFRV